MFKKQKRTLIAAVVSAVLGAPLGAYAVTIDMVQIGTWTTAPQSAAAGTGLQTGGKYVIRSTYDTASATTVKNINGVDLYEVNLQASGNSFDIFAPMQGFDSPGNSFVYHQNQSNNDSSIIPAPTIQFKDSGKTNFAGYDFAGQTVAGAGTNVVDVYTDVATLAGGVKQVNQITEFTNSSGLAIRSINSLQTAKELAVDAGSNLSYSASVLSVQTNGGSTQDNDLGVGRSDGEDFLNYSWKQGGAALTGASVSGVRSDGRVVDDVNIAVAIQNSGLKTTIDTVAWTVDLDEDLTGKSGATDTATISYKNSGPEITQASATADGDAIVFNLDVADLDLGINSLIADFEILDIDLFLNDVLFLDMGQLLLAGTQRLEQTTLLSLFGEGISTLEVRATDRAARRDGSYVSAFINFTVNPLTGEVPEPATMFLFGAGLAGLGVMSRRRRSVTQRVEENKHV